MRDFFVGHNISSTKWDLGPAKEELPGLSILVIEPGPRLAKRTYTTVGAWRYGMRRLEFLAIGDGPRDVYVELLTMVSFYSIDHRLGMGHTFPVGRPLVDGSLCEHAYLSLPYLFGPDLEVHHVDGETNQFLWVFPITSSEKEFLLREGLDALEERLEHANVEYWKLERRPVV